MGSSTGRAAALGAALLMLASGSPAAESAHWCGTHTGGTAAAVAAHRERLEGPVRSAAASGALDFDTDGIAVLIDQGDLVLPQKLFDLSRAGLRLTPQGGGWSVARVDAAPLPASGLPLGLGDDDGVSVALAFSFPFHGLDYAEVFVNSDGNLTFGGPDSASTPRDLGRLLEGPPRIAPLLADFDPSSGGQVTADAGTDALVVTWTGVPQWDRRDANDFQVVLRPDGSIEMSWSRVSGAIASGVVGVSPGGSPAFTPLDFSALGTASVQEGALAESFRDETALDLVATARRFYAGHPDVFDQLVVFSNRRLVSEGTFAFHRGISNAVRGIGLGVSNDASSFGSAGRLEGIAMMDDIAKYPADPAEVFLGEDSALGVLAHETGHRWLARVRFRDGATDSTELLGRQSAHWSFYLDTDGSYLEGNDIADAGDGSFETAGAGLRYSALDLYLMGLLPPESVPPFFFVRDVAGGGEVDATREPETGVAFTGQRVDVTIDAVIASMGVRSPAAGPPPGPWRQAFLYVSSNPEADPTDLERLRTLRAAWADFFAAATSGLWSVDASLP